MTLLELATLVRDEAERWARDVGYEAETLEQQCAVCSWAFVAAAEAVGIEAEIANGFYLDEVAEAHFWAFAWERGVRGTRLVDLTLTQYQPDAERVAVFTVPDAMLKRYAFLGYGEDARESVREHDEEDIATLTARVLACLQTTPKTRPAPSHPLEASTP